MDKKIKISSIVVCYNEKDNIRQCLNSLLNQKFPKNQYEILVIDNNSTDGTIDILKEYSKKHKNLKYYINKERGIAGSRNIGIQKARYNLIAFTDADCIVPEDWLSNYEKAYLEYASRNNRIAGVGSGNRAPDNTLFYKSLSVMLNSFLGSRGSTQGKIYKTPRIVNHIPCVNVMYKKDAIKKIGGFNKKFGNIGEDQDLTYRLNNEGFKLYYIPDNVVVHKMRSNIIKWAKNMFTYGKGRIWLIKNHPSMLSSLFLAPISLVLLLISPLFYSKLLYIILLYLGIIFTDSIWESLKQKKIYLFWYVFLLFFVTHLSYGLGEIYGIFKKQGLKTK